MILTLREVESILRCSALSFIVICIINILSASTASTVKPKYDFGDYKILEKKVTLNLECEVPSGVSSEIMWTKDNNTNPITTDGRFKVSDSTLTIEKPTDIDTGNYTCRLANKTLADSGAVIQVVSLPTGDMKKDTMVVEGDVLSLKCNPSGKPTPSIVWEIGNNSYSTSSGRVELISVDGVPNAELRINETLMTDRGEYRCYPSNLVNTDGNKTIQVISTKVRVKDKLAALWPFLGICAEVFVLCAIILIYEKKRNKAELDESDTDNSPEQKNTPDHGKDSVRQRK